MNTSVHHGRKDVSNVIFSTLSSAKKAIFAFLLLFASASFVNAQATLTTDVADYAPGSTVTITGTGFGPLETVMVQVLHDDPLLDNGEAVHIPFPVTADQNGEINTTWIVPIDLDEVGTLLIATATGQSSGASAFVYFTDNASVVTATGGTAISADNAANATGGGAYTTLNGMSISENLNTDFSATVGSVTLILSAPAGWKFNPGQGSVNASGGKDIHTAPPPGPTILVTASTITVTFAVDGTAKSDNLTITGIQVKADDGANFPGTGNITRTGGTAAIAGVTIGTNFGTLSQAAGAAKKLTFAQQPSNAVVATVISPAITVQIADQFGNAVTANPQRSITLSINNSGVLSGTNPVTTVLGLSTFNSISVTPAGTYNLTATAGGGGPALTSAVSNSFIISPPCTAPTISSIVGTNVTCNGANNGSINLTTSGGTPTPLTYLWSNGAITEDISGLAPGNYSVTVKTASGGCSVTSGTVSITQPILVTVSASSTNVSCNGAADGTITASGSVGSTITVNGLPLSNPYGPGTYTVVATAPNGNANGFCTASTSVTITQPILVTVSASSTNVSCNGAADGTITASGSVGSTITVNGLPLSNPYGPGTYTVVATAPNGNANGFCTASTSVTITQPILVTVSASSTNVSCNGAADGTITASGSVGSTITVNGLPLSNPYGPGTYTVVATAPNGNANGFCTASTSVTITQPILVTVSASSTNVSCNGAADGTITASGSVGSTITVNGLPLSNPYGPGTYTVVATAPNGNANGFCTASTSVTITQPILVTVSASSTNVSCNGAADGTITASGSVGSTITVNGLPLSNPYGPGTYTVVATAPNGNANGFCTASTSVTITEPILVTVSASSTNVSCNGAADGTITASGSVGSTITVNGLPLSNPYGPGTYTVVATAPNGNANGFCTASTSVTITQPILVTVSASSTNVSCNGAADGTITASGSVGSTITVNGLPLSNPYGPGTYTVVATAPNGNADGFCTASTSVTITEPILVTVSASSTNVSCNGAADGTITASGSVGSTITVNGLPLSNPYGPGTYTVVATAPNGNANGFCTASTSVTITQPILVTVSASSTNVSCNGAADGTITASGSVGSTITVNGLPLSNPYGPGTYTVVATAPNGNADGFCTASTSVTITQPILVTVSASSTNVSCNGAADGTITASGSVGSTITVNGLPLSNPYGPGTYTVVATAPNGNANGFCTASTSVTITEPILVTVSASSTNVSCNGAADGTITASGSVGSTITVNGLPLSNPYGPGTYTVVATAPNGNANGFCTASTSVTITQPILVTVSASSTNVSCNGAADGTITASGSVGSTITVNGLPLSNPYGPGTYTVVATAPNGNANGFCTASTSVTITQPILVTVSASSTNVSCNGAADGTITASGSVGSTITVNGLPLSNPYGPGTYTVVATAPNGNADGFCTASTSVTITQPILVTVSASSTNVSCNGAADGTITASGSVGSTITVNGLPLSNPYGPGTYTVVATAPNGNANGFCTASKVVTITQPATLVASCANSNPILFYGFSGDQSSTVGVTPTGGTGPYNITIKMSRSLVCNYINDAGDESWTSSGSTLYNGCPVNPNVNTQPAPITTFTGVYTGSVNVTLLKDADIIICVTDAHGCKASCTTHVTADDARCFAGKDNKITKVTMCHRTGSAKNPCVTICVDDSAVAALKAQGDFVGKCTVDCVAPANNTFVTVNPNQPKPTHTAPEFSVKIAPNPSQPGTEFTLVARGKHSETVEVKVMDMYGKTVYQTSGSANQTYKFGGRFVSGMYIVQVLHGTDVTTYKVVKGN